LEGQICKFSFYYFLSFILKIKVSSTSDVKKKKNLIFWCAQNLYITLRCTFWEGKSLF
jgi:hypothetical protein